MNRARTISVIMPALNEEKNISAAIHRVLKAFTDFQLNGEIVAVNDGSRDRTPDLVKELIKTDSRIRLIEHPSPQGIGKSFWDGVEAAQSEVVVLLPGDNENDPDEIFRYYELLNHVDIVIPFVYNKEVRSFFRNLLSYVYRLIINTTFLVQFNYTNGTVMYRRNVLRTLKFRSAGFFFQTDILIRLVKGGYLFAEVPYRLDVRDTGRSKAVSFPSLMKVARGYLKLLKSIYWSGEHRLPRNYQGQSMTAFRHSKGDKMEAASLPAIEG